MKTPTSILSWGVVSPGGPGAGPLQSTVHWPLAQIAEVARPLKQHLVGTIDLSAPHLQRWATRPRLRRASPISYYMIEAAAQALEPYPEIDRSRVGLVSVSFLGCLLYSLRFYRQFQKEGRRFASPALFPETVANTPLSHVAAELGIGGPVYSLIGDKSAWATALRTASCWLELGDADHVLLIGAEEFEAHALDAFRSAGWLSKPYTRAFTPGAGAILLTKSDTPKLPRLLDIQDGFCFHDKRTSRAAAIDCLSAFPSKTPMASTATGWIQDIADALLANHPGVPNLPALEIEGFTASCAWDTIRAAAYLQSQPGQSLIIPYWGLTQQIGAIHLGIE